MIYYECLLELHLLYPTAQEGCIGHTLIRDNTVRFAIITYILS